MGKPWRTFPAVLAVALLCPTARAAEEPAGDTLADEVPGLVMDLGADAADTRDAARRRLLELGGPTTEKGERMLDLLPEPVAEMPAAVRESLAQIRRRIADRIARLAVGASRVTLDVVDEPLSNVLKLLEQQTGNRLLDRREQFGQQAPNPPVTLTVEDAPFWEAIDQLLDEAGLGVYAYSGEPALALVGREPGATQRWAAAEYAGPLRVEAVRVTALRNLRQVRGESLNLQLEVAWEPRLSPIAFSQPLGKVEAMSEDGARLSMTRPERSIDIEVQPGGQAVELTLPMLLPSRETSLIESLRGELQAVVSGRQAEFRFDGLDSIDEPVVRQKGGVTVKLVEVRKSNEIWELHMRLRMEDAGAGGESVFASHRGWVFNNPTFLVDADGNEIEHAGFENTMQRGNEIGIAYLFELPDGPKGLTWVYRTPTAIVRFPVEYELNHIPLP